MSVSGDASLGVQGYTYDSQQSFEERLSIPLYH